MRNKSSSKRIDKPLIAFILMAIVLNIYRSSRLTLMPYTYIKISLLHFFQIPNFYFYYFFLLATEFNPK